tara:strand:+ start:494 stop:1609 length:1116 start_codon:yes stop_codon:yes gene_type:complete
MKVLRQGVLPRMGEFSYLKSNTFPNIVLLPSGRILAGYRAGEIKTDPVHQKALLTWSDDGGITWREAFEPFQLKPIDGKPGRAHSLYLLPLGGENVLLVANWVDHSEPNQPFYEPSNQHLKDTRIFHCLSQDNGATWSEPKLMETSKANGPTPLTGAPLMLADGRIVCQFEINKYAQDPKPWIHRSALIFSRDLGKTWGEMIEVTNYPQKFFWDQRPAVMKESGKMINFFWTFDGVSQSYKNIHASLSSDFGNSWSLPYDTGIYGQPGSPVDMGKKGLFTIDIDRRKAPVITIRNSHDDGKSYPKSFPLYKQPGKGQDSENMELNQAWDEMYRFTTGHPHLLKISADKLWAYFYTGSSTDNTSIHWMEFQI